MVKISVLLSFVFLIAFGFVVHGSSATKEVGVYEIKKGNFSVKFTNWGATIISVILPDKNGMVYTCKKSLAFFFFSLFVPGFWIFWVLIFQESLVMLFLAMIQSRITWWILTHFLLLSFLFSHRQTHRKDKFLVCKTAPVLADFYMGKNLFCFHLEISGQLGA